MFCMLSLFGRLAQMSGLTAMRFQVARDALNIIRERASLMGMRVARSLAIELAELLMHLARPHDTASEGVEHSKGQARADQTRQMLEVACDAAAYALHCHRAVSKTAANEDETVTAQVRARHRGGAHQMANMVR